MFRGLDQTHCSHKPAQSTDMIDPVMDNNDDDTWCNGIQCDDIQCFDDDLCHWEYSTQTLDPLFASLSSPLPMADCPLSPIPNEIIPIHRLFPNENPFPLVATAVHRTMNANACAGSDAYPTKPARVPEEVTESNFIDLIYHHLYGSTPSDGPMHATDSKSQSRQCHMAEQDSLPHGQAPPQRSTISEKCSGLSTLHAPPMDCALVSQSYRLQETLHGAATPRMSTRMPTNCSTKRQGLSSINKGTFAIKSDRNSRDSHRSMHASRHLAIMCPPLTAYNYFYRHERDTIVQGMTRADDPLPAAVWDFTLEKKAELLRQHWYDYCILM
jgi:hypothetical protein